jgi:hypothetical protein
MAGAVALVGCGGCWNGIIPIPDVELGKILDLNGDPITDLNGDPIYNLNGSEDMQFDEYPIYDGRMLPDGSYMLMSVPGDGLMRMDVSGTGFMQYIEITGTSTSTIQDNRLKDRRIKLIVYGLQALKPDLFTQDLSLGTVTSDLLAGINDTITLYY